MATQDEDAPAFQDIDWKKQDEEDAAEAERIMSMRQEDLEAYLKEDPDGEFEKDENAQDFEDISDDDLPEEEFTNDTQQGDNPGLTDDAGTSNDTDDLFGEDRDSSPFRDFEHDDQQHPPLQQQGSTLSFPSLEPNIDLLEKNGLTRSEDPAILDAPEYTEELLSQVWPAYVSGVAPKFNELMPTKIAHYIPKVPVKAPKPVAPSKVSLDLAPDQEKSFRAPGPAFSDKRKRIAEAQTKGWIPIIEESGDEESDEEDFDWSTPPPDETIGGVSWADLEVICADWETMINQEPIKAHISEDLEDPVDEWELEFLGPKTKRRKITHEEPDYINLPQYPMPSFDNFEQDIARLGKRVRLDLNDPNLLVDDQYTSAAKRQRLDKGIKRTGKGAFASTLNARYNISNDAAYEALKENHQHKVRATLGNVAIEHSMPAQKLQWPYYRVKLNIRDARSYHRPSLHFKRFLGETITFAKPGTRKKKEVKNMATSEVFKTTKDLTLGDHWCTATLLEYSEEHPTVLSNFGMGNRIVNYYRRKDHEDQERPQPEDKIGDLQILLPEDKSPFSNFGMVDPGETVRTIHNAMYRAPIFKHERKSTDFLVVRNSTGVEGSTWQIRNIDNVFAVGQQFPSIEIPGPHSRKVTNATKARMKMLAYRKIRHSAAGHLKIQDITAHIQDSQDMQNRQKLKEFIVYDKVDKVWKMKPGDQVPDEQAIRAMVKPEDVCTIDAMQVGSQHLEDAGYAVQEDENDELREGASDEQHLAPWETSKAFLDASAGKAMLQLHGAGDPSGCGLGISMIKISMKGGYVGVTSGPNATSSAAIMDLKKANGGHTYNVKKQEAAYNDAIRQIWDLQKANLSDPTEHAETEFDREQAEEDARAENAPYSAPTPGVFDESASQFSVGSRQAGKMMRIIREVKNGLGQIDTVEHVVTDPRVWREYLKRREALDSGNQNPYDLKAGDENPQHIARVKEELARLERNKERRLAREKQKNKQAGLIPADATSPSSTPKPTIEKGSTGTTRKCANCGEVGHIKTNKKYYCHVHQPSFFENLSAPGPHLTGISSLVV